ncbi:unnamed protein product [Rotaria sp. Silwood2]|nr:unnamed protein product [Rotaria sp. Silwood2]
MVYSNQQQNRYSIDNIIGQLPQSCYYHQCSCPATQVDPLSNVHFISKENRRHQRIPPPLSTNTIPINSPARSKRGTLSSPPSNQNLTTAATRYATTRFPFPPYITRFKSNQVTLNHFNEDIVHHFKNNHQINIEILNCRSSKVKCNNDEIDFLLYLKDSVSFASLYDQTIWPLKLAGNDYTFPSWPSIPPQLSLILKNVNVQIDLEDFTNEVKALVPDVKNVIRMKNKFGNNIHMIKLELVSLLARQDLIDAKKLIINYISYEVTEFLAPVTVLICSKYSGIGHFRKQCTEQNETCKTCVQTFADLKNHHCTMDPLCKHCNGNHLSNPMKCPIIKTFRAELTKKILNTNVRSSSTADNNNNNNNTNNNINNKYIYNPQNFPPLPTTQSTLNNSVMLKLDELMTKMSEVKEHLSNLTSKHEKYEQFMIEKTQNDERVNQQIELLLLNDQDLKKDLLQLKLLIERRDNLFMKLLFPMFEDLFSHIAALNQDKRGNTLDADLKVRLERYLIQVKKTKEGKLCMT